MRQARAGAVVIVALAAALATRARAQPNTTPPLEGTSPVKAEEAGKTETTTTTPTQAPAEPDEGWGTLEPGYGKGFNLGTTKLGTLNLSAYSLFRFIDQLGNDTYTDHLGVEHPVDRRLDITLHRMLVYLNGWIYDPKFVYNTTVWAILSTQQVNVIGSMTYLFDPAFRLSVGVGGLPGTRSLQNVFPYFQGTDRVMADDFFRPGFTSGIWASGMVLPGLAYTAMVGNGLSQVGIKANQLNRYLATAASVWWMPTTGEFGPRGGFGDYVEHRQVATRFGVSFTHSREDAKDENAPPSPDNTQIKLSDGLNAFAVGALAPGVQLRWAHYWLFAADAGLKYRGLSLQGEYYYRRLDRFEATGPLPLDHIVDQGFYVQASYFAVPRRLMLYGLTSVIFGQFNDPWEAGGGANVFPFSTRNMRLNVQVTYVHHSPVSSLFGYYTAGETGPIVSAAADMIF